jgi:hypothetical protein
VPETNHVSGACSVAAALYLQFMLHGMLFNMIKLLHFTLLLSAVWVQYPVTAVFLHLFDVVLSLYFANIFSE